jgi:hypothetical protein
VDLHRASAGATNHKTRAFVLLLQKRLSHRNSDPPVSKNATLSCTAISDNAKEHVVDPPKRTAAQMAKKREAAAAPRAAQNAQAKPNPFELKRSKRKFDVLGRKIKGDGKNVVKSREDALLKVRVGFCVRGAMCVAARGVRMLPKTQSPPRPLPPC